MTTTTKSRRSDQEKAERRTAFLEMATLLEGELKEGKHTERLAKIAKDVQGLQRYSPLNQLLILTQCPHATDTHGYVEWKGLGYQVRKGEQGIAIRAPHARKATEGEESAGVGFHRIYVFDLSQVDPIPSEEAQEPEAASAVVD